jgi:histone H3/H4
MQEAINLFIPVMEMATYAAARYANACDRNTVTATDMEYGMKFAAMNQVGKQVGSYFPDIYDESESDTDTDTEESDEDEFTRYTGSDESILEMNRAYDSWDSWVPENPLEIMIKRSIDEKNKTV